MHRTVKNLRYPWLIASLLAFAISAFAQTNEIRLKLADGSYMVVDDAWESPQGVWYRKGGLSHLLAKDKVKKIERNKQKLESTWTDLKETVNFF